MTAAARPTFDTALSAATELVFVCTGNMVRSAFADLYARHLDCPLPVRSCATTYRNTSLFPETRLALGARGVPLEWTRTFRPTHLDDLAPEIGAGAVVLCMTEQHLAALDAYPGLAERGWLLAEVLGAEERIADPVEEGADFVATFAYIERCVDALVERLRESSSGV